METKKKIMLVVGVGVVGVAAYYLLMKKSPAAVHDTGENASSTASASASIPTSPTANALPVSASPSCPFPPGTLVRVGKDAKVFLINNQCQRQWITTRQKFDSLGLDMNNVVSVSTQVMNSIPLGADLSGLGCAYRYLS